MGCRLAAPRSAGLLEAPLEALDPAAAVHQLLLARVERVAVRAHLDVQLGLGRPGLERVSAGAVDVRQDVLGTDLGLHRPARIAAAVSVAPLPPETTATTVSPCCSDPFPASSAAVAVVSGGNVA